MHWNAFDPSSWLVAEVLPHGPALRAYLVGHFPTLADVDDLVQESIIRVLHTHERNPVRSPKALLFTTARHLALDAMRRQQVVAIEPLAENPDSPVYKSDANIAETFSKKEEFDHLARAIQALPEGCRRVLTLRVAYGFTQKEIGAKLGISENTVEKHMATGIRRCREYFGSIGLP